MQVIAHNLESQFANRQLNTTAKEKAKSTEKLSSGYRINRSADDAAGLQISEKMRWQIRGLDKTVDNCEAGSSFCEVADGAMQQMEDILHRMRELSVQAANDTNTLVDRQAIQDEINQLVIEIGRITGDTEFNTLDVFGWERAAVSYKPNATTPGGWVTQGPPTSAPVTGNNYGLGEILGSTNIYQDSKLNDPIKFDTNGWTSTGGNMYGSLVSVDKVIKELNQYTSITANSTDFLSSTPNSIVYDDIANGYRTTIKFDAGKQTLDGKYPAQYITLEYGNYSGGTFTPEKNILKKQLTTSYGSAGYNDGKNYGSAWLDFSGLNKDFIISDLYGKGFSTTCASSGCKRYYNISFTGGNCSNTTANGVNYNYRYTGNGNDPRDMKAALYLEIDISDCMSGEDITNHIIEAVNACKDFNSHYTQYAVNQSEPAKLYIYDNRNQIINGGSSTFIPTQRDDNGKPIVGEDNTVHKGDPPTEKIVYTTKHMWIQSGTTNLSGFFLEKPILNPTILGITRISVLDYDAASVAIDSCDSAINILNDERSKIGAQQNRLESAILVNANTEENTQAAESRLRDTDMAEEMVNYSKSSILEQAGQAMLAQANQSKQGILSLFS